MKRPVSRILSSALKRTAIIHLGRSLPNGSSGLPGNAVRPSPDTERAARKSVSLFGLAPRGVYLAAHVTTRAGELLPHRFTHHPDKSRLVYSLLHLSSPDLIRCPDVIRLAALWCSDFPLSLEGKATARPASLQGLEIIAKNVEQLNFQEANSNRFPD